MLLKHTINSCLTSTGLGRIKRATRWNDVPLLFLALHPDIYIILKRHNSAYTRYKQYKVGEYCSSDDYGRMHSTLTDYCHLILTVVS